MKESKLSGAKLHLKTTTRSYQGDDIILLGPKEGGIMEIRDKKFTFITFNVTEFIAIEWFNETEEKSNE